MVFLYIPNIVGYFRVLLIILFYVFFSKNNLISLIFYLISFILDVFDGYLARYMNQCSSFGAVLDMITDRISTLILCILNFEKEDGFLKNLILIWIVFDISSHWMQTLSAANEKISHKNISTKFKILKFYYSSKIFMGSINIGNEIFLLMNLFIKGNPSILVKFIYVLSFFLFCGKGIVNVLQFISNVIYFGNLKQK